MVQEEETKYLERPDEDALTCPACGAVARQEKCKIVCRSERCIYRIIYNCSEF